MKNNLKIIRTASRLLTLKVLTLSIISQWSTGDDYRHGLDVFHGNYMLNSLEHFLKAEVV